MLSAFSSRPVLELKQRDKSKIESVLAYGILAHEIIQVNDTDHLLPR